MINEEKFINNVKFNEDIEKINEDIEEYNEKKIKKKYFMKFKENFNKNKIIKKKIIINFD